MQSFLSVAGSLVPSLSWGWKRRGRNHFMSDAVNLARLMRINDQLIEFLKWAMESEKLDCAALLAPITRDFTSILADMGAKELEVLKRRGKKKLVRNVASRLGGRRAPMPGSAAVGNDG